MTESKKVVLFYILAFTYFLYGCVETTNPRNNQQLSNQSLNQRAAASIQSIRVSAPPPTNWLPASLITQDWPIDPRAGMNNLETLHIQPNDDSGGFVSFSYSSAQQNPITGLPSSAKYSFAEKNHSEGYNLNLMFAKNVSVLPEQGQNTVIVAKINDYYHVRIFDIDGKMVLDKGKNEFSPDSALFQALDDALNVNSSSQQIDSANERQLIQKITLNLGHTHSEWVEYLPNTAFRPNTSIGFKQQYHPQLRTLFFVWMDNDQLKLNYRDDAGNWGATININVMNPTNYHLLQTVTGVNIIWFTKSALGIQVSSQSYDINTGGLSSIEQRTLGESFFIAKPIVNNQQTIQFAYISIVTESRKDGNIITEPVIHIVEKYENERWIIHENIPTAFSVADIDSLEIQVSPLSRNRLVLATYLKATKSLQEREIHAMIWQRDSLEISWEKITAPPLSSMAHGLKRPVLISQEKEIAAVFWAQGSANDLSNQLVAKTWRGSGWHAEEMLLGDLYNVKQIHADINTEGLISIITLHNNDKLVQIHASSYFLPVPLGWQSSPILIDSLALNVGKLAQPMTTISESGSMSAVWAREEFNSDVAASIYYTESIVSTVSISGSVNGTFADSEDGSIATIYYDVSVLPDNYSLFIPETLNWLGSNHNTIYSFIGYRSFEKDERYHSFYVKDIIAKELVENPPQTLP